MQNKNPFSSALRVMPSFFILAIVGCLIGRFVMHESLNRLAVDVSVPIMATFLFTRVLVLLMPRDASSPPAPLPKRPVLYVFRTIASLIFFGGFFGSILIISAAIYGMVGFYGASQTALHFAAFCLGEATASFLFFVAAAWVARQIGVRLLVLCFKLVHIFWRVLWAPNQLASVLFGNFGSPVAH